MKRIKKLLYLRLFLICSGSIAIAALILTLLLASNSDYYGAMKVVATESYGQLHSPHNIKGEYGPEHQSARMSHEMLADNSSGVTGRNSGHKPYEISDQKFNYTFQSTEYYKSKSYIPVHKFWNDDPLNVFIDINPDTIKMSSKFLPDVHRAIYSWSDLLKSSSGNYSSWNFDVTPALKNAVHTAIIIKLSGDPLGQICNDSKVKTYAITIYPHVNDQNAYLDIPTSCLVDGNEQEASHQEIYSTVLHEFGHALGLGHAHNQDGDLMCSTELTNQTGVTDMTCEPYSVLNAKPSELDIKALFYIYGKDGFNEPNNKMLDCNGCTRSK
jgi:hypothetical protein